MTAERERLPAQLRAVLEASRADAERTGASLLTEEEIIAEIREYRREKRLKSEAGSKDAVYPI